MFNWVLNTSLNNDDLYSSKQFLSPNNHKTRKNQNISKAVVLITAISKVEAFKLFQLDMLTHHPFAT